MANLERAQEERLLTQDEQAFKRYLKSKALGLAAVQKTRARQHSRLTWIRKGDTNTRLFQLHANARRKKIFIPSLNGHLGAVVSQEEKSKLIHTHFSQVMGTSNNRTKAINWDELGYVHHNLEELDAPFTQEEVARVIKEMPSEKSPGPDGFIGLFYKKCWTIIKDDLTQAILSFYSHRTTRLNLVNEANIVLLPKNQIAATISDYRSISPINSVAKIITKLLANLLAPCMNELVSTAQNAFIKKRCIHDNFIYSQRVIELLHQKRKPALFIKLDISKAFDSVGWTFLLEVMQALGFSIKWRDWIAALLGTASSKVLVNGQLTRGIRHARGLRQGDSFSPLLFILAIDPLQLLKWRPKEVSSNRSYQRQQGLDVHSLRMMRLSSPTHQPLI